MPIVIALVVLGVVLGLPTYGLHQAVEAGEARSLPTHVDVRWAVLTVAATAALGRCEAAVRRVT